MSKLPKQVAVVNGTGNHVAVTSVGRVAQVNITAAPQNAIGLLAQATILVPVSQKAAHFVLIAPIAVLPGQTMDAVQPIASDKPDRAGLTAVKLQDVYQTLLYVFLQPTPQNLLQPTRPNQPVFQTIKVPATTILNAVAVTVLLLENAPPPQAQQYPPPARPRPKPPPPLNILANTSIINAAAPATSGIAANFTEIIIPAPVFPQTVPVAAKCLLLAGAKHKAILQAPSLSATIPNAPGAVQT